MKFIRMKVKRRDSRSKINQWVLAIPKLSRSQLSDLGEKLLGTLDLHQVAFGDPQIYRFFLRPGSMAIYKTKATKKLPVWANNLKSSLPLGPRQIFSLATSREASQIELVNSEKPIQKILVDRNGFVVLENVSKSDIQRIQELIEKSTLNENYRVFHSIHAPNLEKNYSCSYFQVRRVKNRIILRLKSRLEETGEGYYKLRTKLSNFMTFDELLVLQRFTELLLDYYPIADFCVQTARGENSVPGRLLGRDQLVDHPLSKIRTSTEVLVEFLNEARYFSSQVAPGRMVFVPCADLKIILHRKNKQESIPKSINVQNFYKTTFQDLGEWCYDSRHLLSLAEVWETLYPGDLKSRSS